MDWDIEEPILGCWAHELEIGTEFSRDEGASWLVVRTEPRYVSDELDCLTLRFLASPIEEPNLGAWQEVLIEDSTRVLLEREWKGYEV